MDDFARIRAMDKWLFAHLEFEPSEVTALRASSALDTVRTRKPTVGYRDADAPLVEEALSGIKTGKYRNPWDAAQALSARAAGNSKPESKVTRLAARIAEAKKAAQN